MNVVLYIMHIVFSYVSIANFLVICVFFIVFCSFILSYVWSLILLTLWEIAETYNTKTTETITLLLFGVYVCISLLVLLSFVLDVCVCVVFLMLSLFSMSLFCSLIFDILNAKYEPQVATDGHFNWNCVVMRTTWDGT